MRALRLLFSPSGRLAPRAFSFAAIMVYVAGAASQLLTVPGVMAWVGIWLFAVVQAILIWIWFALHANRLRDAGRTTGLAAGVSLLYALSVVLLVFVAAAFFNTSNILAADANTTSALGLILLVSTVAALLGSPNYDFGWFIVAILTALSLVPIILAVAVTLFAAMLPSVEGSSA